MFEIGARVYIWSLGVQTDMARARRVFGSLLGKPAVVIAHKKGYNILDLLDADGDECGALDHVLRRWPESWDRADDSCPEWIRQLGKADCNA